jgi:hypothetical protein
MPRLRHIQTMALPNAPRLDAAMTCAEPGGRSGRSYHHDDSRRERSRRAAFKGYKRKKISSASQRASRSGECASEPAQPASGA